ncbi:ATP-dependent DNA helicase RecG [Candidatus Uhrbacteria bacterium]|nr:ATP-dependent DNA helicase RecG [Candidatus Uhrbacteria bacterium]
MISWNDPIAFIRGLTAQQRKAAALLGCETVGQLLDVFPRRYDDYSRTVPIAEIQDGIPVTVACRVVEIFQVKTFRRSFILLKAKVADASGTIDVTWFNQPWLLKTLLPGTDIFLSGVVTRRPRLGRGFTSPLWELNSPETLAAGIVAPVYPLHGAVSQKMVRALCKAAVEQVTFLEDWLPETVRIHVRVSPLDQAYRQVHRPHSMQDAEAGRTRFAFGELFLYQCALRIARFEADVAGAPQVLFDTNFAKQFVAQLPFELTDDQKKAVWGIIQNMSTKRPMRRLLQGDVGSGKTVVAAMLSALVYRSQQSAVFMAPTDLLAKQHFETLRRFLLPFQIPILLRTGSARILVEGGEERKLTVDQINQRTLQGRIVCIGTHALIEKNAAPPDVALAVVDEQHRFGVVQREALAVAKRHDGLVPHLLSMSATPIPRSLALTFLGDLEMSIISTKPKGRQAIETMIVVGDRGHEKAYERIRSEVIAGRRAFIVCPFIEESDVIEARNVEAEVRRLQNGPLKGLRIGMVHGRIPTREKDATMQAFADGGLDILVATTVIEVGVDVPQATVILIESSERFGLAQLHQLRGRVGRSSYKSYCFLGLADDGPAIGRLRVLEKTQDGFVVAEADLNMRGEGNVLGTQQSGEVLFKTARITDVNLISTAKEQAEKLAAQDATYQSYPALYRLIQIMRENQHRE